MIGVNLRALINLHANQSSPCLLVAAPNWALQLQESNDEKHLIVAHRLIRTRNGVSRHRNGLLRGPASFIQRIDYMPFSVPLLTLYTKISQKTEENFFNRISRGSRPFPFSELGFFSFVLLSSLCKISLGRVLLCC